MSRRIAVAFALLLISIPALAFEPMEPVVSDVFTADGTQAELAKRGEICIARLIRNDEVTLTDSPLGNGFGKLQKSNGADVITLSSADSGVIVANARLPMQMWMNSMVLQSTMTLEAKDGRFRMTYSSIQHADKHTAFSSNPGFTPVLKRSPLEKRAAEELRKLASKIADCVKQPVADF